MVKYIAIYFVVKIYFNIYNLFTIFHPIKVLIYNEMRVEVIDRTIIGVGDERGGCSTSKLFQILIRQCGLLKGSITHRKFIVSVKLLHIFEHFGGMETWRALTTITQLFSSTAGAFSQNQKIVSTSFNIFGWKSRVEAHLLKMIF